jgi:uncharacterized protein (UPF0305 family)
MNISEYIAKIHKDAEYLRVYDLSEIKAFGVRCFELGQQYQKDYVEKDGAEIDNIVAIHERENPDTH